MTGSVQIYLNGSFVDSETGYLVVASRRRLLSAAGLHFNILGDGMDKYKELSSWPLHCAVASLLVCPSSLNSVC